MDNLTRHLIRKNGYVEAFVRIKSRDEFLKHVSIDLGIGDVLAMSPAKLGEIMCAFEAEDVTASKEQLFTKVYFAGNCGAMLRDLVSICLAYAICRRITTYTISPEFSPSGTTVQ